MLVIILIIIIILLIIILLQKKETFNNAYLDQNNIKRITKEISINRPVGSSNLSKVKSFVINELNNLGLEVSEQKFTRTIKDKEYKFSNIIAKNKYVDDNYIILGAHIDGPQIDIMESATDAATCIALIIEIVRNLLIKNKDYPIMIVFFDGEEAIDGEWSDDNTLSGSSYFVSNFNKNIKLLMIFDLIGADINKNKIYHFITNDSNKNLMKQLSNINNSNKYNKQIFVDPDIKTSMTAIVNDYTPFDKKYNNLVGLNIIPETFPDYHHTVDDNYNNVNWEYIDIFSNVVYEFLLAK
jgi:hypothetical protein